MKILLFIVLKVIEIGGIIFIPYFLGKKVKDFAQDYEKDCKCLIWCYGTIVILAILLIIMIFPGLINWFKLNWDIVNQIIK